MSQIYAPASANRVFQLLLVFQALERQHTDTSLVAGVFPEMFAVDFGYLLRRLRHREMRK